MALLPVISSSNTTPKLYTSDLAVSWPVLWYSGAQYPYVPITLEETCELFPIGPSLANPKSDSLALKSWSSKMFEDFKSRYMTGGLAFSCKYSRPLAACKAIFIRVYQSNGRWPSERSDTDVINYWWVNLLKGHYRS